LIRLRQTPRLKALPRLRAPLRARAPPRLKVPPRPRPTLCTSARRLLSRTPDRAFTLVLC
ncbi:hypothetical protein GGF37_002857, partial [Kickxella alabastrina]